MLTAVKLNKQEVISLRLSPNVEFLHSELNPKLVQKQIETWGVFLMFFFNAPNIYMHDFDLFSEFQFYNFSYLIGLFAK